LFCRAAGGVPERRHGASDHDPRSEWSSAAIGRKQQTTAGEAVFNMTILALDDEPVMLKIMEKLLRLHAVLPAANWDEAIRTFRDNAATIELLIADVTIPVVSGVQVARLIRGDNPRLPVILISGYPLPNWSAPDLRDLKELGGDSIVVLQKPFERQQLLDAIERLTGGHSVATA
jgi:CheY-like chemotaxis protein